MPAVVVQTRHLLRCADSRAGSRWRWFTPARGRIVRAENPHFT